MQKVRYIKILELNPYCLFYICCIGKENKFLKKQRRLLCLCRLNIWLNL